MKTFIKSLALALTLGTVSFATTAATAKPERPITYASYETVVYPSQTAPVVNVVVKKEAGSTVSVRFKSKKGETLAERALGRGKDTVAMRFRIDDLPDGLYSIEISNGRDVTKKEVKLSTQLQESPRTIAMQ